MSPITAKSSNPETITVVHSKGFHKSIQTRKNQRAYNIAGGYADTYLT